MRSPRRAVVFVPTLVIMLASFNAAHATPPGPIQFGQPARMPFQGYRLQIIQVDGAGGPDAVSVSGGNLQIQSNQDGMTFAPPVLVTMTTNGSILGYVVTDLDHDGRPDLIATTSADELVVRRGIGWPAFDAAVIHRLPFTENGLCAGDLNGDGLPEVVTSFPDGGVISVYRNVGGGGLELWARHKIAGAANNTWQHYPMRDVAVGEFNGDGHPDVIAAVHEDYTFSSSAGVAVLLNQGDGALGSSLSARAVPGPRADLVLGDMNHDGLDDVVVGSEGAPYGILIAMGGGHMAMVDSIEAENPFVIPRSALADLDGDGTLDLVVGRYVHESNYYDLNSVAAWTGVGNGHFKAPVEYQVGKFLYEFQVADLNGDGAQDLAISTSTSFAMTESLSIHHGLGHGRFTGYCSLRPSWPCPIPCYPGDRILASGPTSVGHPADLFQSGGGRLYWWQNRGYGAFESEVDIGAGDLITVRDLNHDGRADLVLNSVGGVAIRRSTGDGQWGAPLNYPGGSFLDLADVDGDAELDLAQVGPDGHMWIRAGGHDGMFAGALRTGFVPQQPESNVHPPGFTRLADLDGDGRADIVSVAFVEGEWDRAIILRIGAGGEVDTLTQFELPTPEAGGSILWHVHPRPYVAASGAGRAPNLLFVNSEGGTTAFGVLSSYRREPDGTYALVSAIPTLREPQGIGVADFDLDGIDDVVLTNGADFDIGSIFAYHCDEMGALTETWTAFPGTYPGIANPVDLDGDSKPDLVIGRSAAHRIGIFTNVTMTDQPTPTLVSLVSAQATPEGVALDWFASGSDAASVLLERSAPAVDWTSIARLTPDGDGHYRFVDGDVVAGARYGYRLRISGIDSGDPTWVTIPARGGLQLLGVMPNPATDNARVRFTLPREVEVRIEVLDVLGRRRGASSPTRMSAGIHELPIPSRGRLTPGVYLLRLSAGGETFTRRFAATR